MFKKVFSTTLVCLMSVALIAGCSTKSNPTTTGTTAPSPNSTANTDAEAFTITISSWNLSNEKLGIVQAYREAFEKVYKAKYPNATIQYNNSPGDVYFDLLKAQMASASGADVIQFQPAQLPVLVKAGYLADLSDMPFVSKIEGAVKTQSSSKGKVYAAPFDLATNGVWYNRKMFADNNIALPKTYDDLLKIAETFKAKGITPFAGGFKDQWVANMTAKVFLPNHYGDLSFEEAVYKGSKKINGPEIQAAFNKLQLLVDKGYFGEDALSNNWNLSRQAFREGKAAMIIQGTYVAGMVNSEMKDKGGMETGFFALPNDNGEPVLDVGTNTLTGVNAKTENVQRAKDLVAAMHDADAQIIRDKDAGVFPAMKGINIPYKEVGNQDLLKVLGSTKSTIVGQYYPASVIDIFGKNLTKMLAGKKFDPSWLDEADKAFTQDKGSVAPPEQ